LILSASPYPVVRWSRTLSMSYANSFQKLGKIITTSALRLINLSSPVRTNEILSHVFFTKICI